MAFRKPGSAGGRQQGRRARHDSNVFKIQVDTVKFELMLPADKVNLIGEHVRTWWGHHSGRRSDFDALLSHLSHAATII